MIEECFCCGAPAPSWETDEHAEWTLELTPEGAYLGVICSGCFAGEGLAFLDVEPSGGVIVQLQHRALGSAGAAPARAGLAEAA